MCSNEIKEHNKETLLPPIKRSIKQKIGEFLRNDDKKTKQDLMWMLLYWLCTSFIFIWYLKDRLQPGCFIISMVLILAPLLLYLLLYLPPLKRKLQKSLFITEDCNKLLILFLLVYGIVALVTIILFTGLTSRRLFTCAISLIFFILSSAVIIYIKDTSGPPNKIHRRYLEYLRTSVWSIIFMFGAYFTFNFLNAQDKLNAALEKAKIMGIPEALTKNIGIHYIFEAISFPAEYPLGSSIVQMGCIVFLRYYVTSICFSSQIEKNREKI